MIDHWVCFHHKKQVCFSCKRPCLIFNDIKHVLFAERDRPGFVFLFLGKGSEKEFLLCSWKTL